MSGVILWVVWGLMVRDFLPPSDRPFDPGLRYGVFIPLVLIGFGLSFTRAYRASGSGL